MLYYLYTFFLILRNHLHLFFKMIDKCKMFIRWLNKLILSYFISAFSLFLIESESTSRVWFWTLLIYCWFSANVAYSQMLWSVRKNISLYFGSKTPRSSHESILQQFSGKLKLVGKIPILYTWRNTCRVMLKGILAKNQYSWDAEQKYYTNFYSVNVYLVFSFGLPRNCCAKAW